MFLLCLTKKQIPIKDTNFWWSQIIVLLSMYVTILSILIVIRVNSPFYLSLRVILCALGFGLLLAVKGISWFFYSLVIMFLGGIIVIFVYASSIRNNFIIALSMNIKYAVLRLIVVRFLYLNIHTRRGRAKLCPTSLYRPEVVRVVILIRLILLSVLFVVSKIVKIEDGAIKL